MTERSLQTVSSNLASQTALKCRNCCGTKTASVSPMPFKEAEQKAPFGNESKEMSHVTCHMSPLKGGIIRHE
ncbi:unnamed protein product [Protopolystoma xenopodis]|uniref:Uncharacterized protein n=1 Tax=Protopolystoma xenopodis TaxID=117903 RepID=A0A3S5FH78_9PLAT|nr:unnamed protein product [Protopolystoma xenopodis]